MENKRSYIKTPWKNDAGLDTALNVLWNAPNVEVYFAWEDRETKYSISRKIEKQDGTYQWIGYIHRDNDIWRIENIGLSAENWKIV